MNKVLAPVFVSIAHSGPSWSTTYRMFGCVVVLPNSGPGPGANVPHTVAVRPHPWARTSTCAWIAPLTMGQSMTPGGGFSLGPGTGGCGGEPARATGPPGGGVAGFSAAGG